MWSLSFIFLLFSMCLFSTLFPFFANLRNPFKELLDFMYYDHLWCWLCFPTSSLLKWQFQMFVVSQPTTPGTTPKDRLFEVLRESSTRFTSIDEADIAAFSDDTVSKISKAANLNFEYDWSRLWSSSSSSCTILYHILPQLLPSNVWEIGSYRSPPTLDRPRRLGTSEFVCQNPTDKFCPSKTESHCLMQNSACQECAQFIFV